MARNERLTIEDTDRLSIIAKALSNRERLAIVKSLINSSLNISEIASQLHIPQSTTALHLKVLEEAGIIQSELLPGDKVEKVEELLHQKNEKEKLAFVGKVFRSADDDRIATLAAAGRSSIEDAAF